MTPQEIDDVIYELERIIKGFSAQLLALKPKIDQINAAGLSKSQQLRLKMMMAKMEEDLGCNDLGVGDIIDYMED